MLRVLEAKGFVSREIRESPRGIKVTETYWKLTEKGLQYV
jgi:DNA-binding PadR family transcriptional regulator